MMCEIVDTLWEQDSVKACLPGDSLWIALQQAKRLGPSAGMAKILDAAIAETAAKLDADAAIINKNTYV
jgi:hypothetical protein